MVAALGNPPLPYNHTTTIDGIRFLVTGEQFRGQFGGLFTTNSIGPFLSSFGDLVKLASTRATPVLPMVGLVGLALLLRRRLAFGLACWGALIAGIDVWANYLHLEHYLLVPWLLLGIGVGVSLDAAAGLLVRVLGGRGLGRLAVVGTAALGAALAIALVVTNLPIVNRHDDRTAQAYADAMVTSAERGDLHVLGVVATAVVHAAGRRPAAGLARRRRHQHRVRGLGQPGTAHRVGDLRAPGVRDAPR
jgi:hypothetical protein